MVNLLAHVDVVLKVFEGGVFGEKLQEADDFFFCGVHGGDCTPRAAGAVGVLIAACPPFFQPNGRSAIKYSFTTLPPRRCSLRMRSRTGGSQWPYQVPSG